MKTYIIEFTRPGKSGVVVKPVTAGNMLEALNGLGKIKLISIEQI